MTQNGETMSYHTMPPDAETIGLLAEQALAEIPEALREQVRGVAISVEEFADDATLAEMGIENEWELTGLYTGTPIGQHSISDIARPPAMIALYRQPILMEWVETGEDLGRLVRNVVIHEIAHHFGFTEAEIEALERD